MPREVRYKSQKGDFRNTELKAYCKRCDVEYVSGQKVLVNMITMEKHCPICRTGLSVKGVNRDGKTI